jgi:hypothetical protein
MVVQYVPALGTGGSSATLAYTTGSTMTFQVDGADPAGADTIGNTSGELACEAASLDTMGELVDYINGRAAWRAYLVGSLRADLSSGLLAVSASSAVYDANGLTIYSDTSTNTGVSLAISGEKFVNNGVAGHVKDADDQCENEMLYGSFNVTCVSAPHLRYYTGKQGSTETLITASKLLVSATATLEGEEIPTGPFIQATRGQRLIMRCITPSAAAPAVSAPVITIAGKTAVLKNNRIVDEDNYLAG